MPAPSSSLAEFAPLAAEAGGPHLALDAGSLAAAELSLPALMRELNLQHRPHWLVRKFVAALELERQVRGLGWARDWNQDGLAIFRTHLHHPVADAAYFAPVTTLLGELLSQAPAPYVTFATELLADPALLTFTFYHNRETDTDQYEGLTLSFGRAVAGQPGKLDRLDLVLEDRRVNGRVDGRLDRLRLYICPWSGYRHGKIHYFSDQTGLALDILTPAQELYEHSVRYYHRWKGDETRQWNHWSARYSDAFAPRTFIPVGTSFC